MSTLHKVKAYFGMVPLDAYDDGYVDEGTPQPRGRRSLDDEFDDYRGERGYAYDGRRADDYDAYEPAYDARGGSYDDRYDAGYERGYREPARASLPRLEPLRDVSRTVAPSTRGALAMDTRADVLSQENPMSRITTLRPTSYEEARTIGERFREGIPVIMDLTAMDNADAKRLVDFAAGLTFALHGSFDRITTKVFMLATADVDVTAEDRARIAETGFYNR
ncbi:cell division protein SepF [Tsukamurella ocularis]|uniref:cell division protein SepF n=1 Tax=Tsukamurella ocularis TaxID=1970234 RepID=UPI00216A3D54|nr:cell division protein SepF [Tsukamurella ocularis]MCS3782217.1 cell division inhibitor SepF [Tsukamurella ocularis]MCS3789623.1 cell division inhibitor SepF [Tsukamurella ocularis]MCS3852770.1 cell division inhibitor SepF [Tsukamurella ocularis]